MAFKVPLSGDEPGTWTSTSGQDRSVATLLGSNHRGYFIELGANAPITGSNSRSLERDHGWSGLCIEANSRLHATLLANRRCDVVGAAVSDEEAMANVVEAGPASQIDDQRTRSRSTVQAPTVLFSRIISHFGVPRSIDYLSLDVEGHEAKAMASFPWRTHRISILTVERASKALQATLTREGYEYVCDHGLYGDQMWIDARAQAALLRRAKRAVSECIYYKRSVLRCEPIGNPAWSCGGGAQGDRFSKAAGSVSKALSQAWSAAARAGG